MSFTAVPRARWLAAITFGLCFAMAMLVVWQMERDIQEAKRAHIHNLAYNHAFLITDNIDRALALNYAMAAIIRSEGGTIPNFDAFVSELLPLYRNVSHLALSPGGVIRQVYPQTGNEAIIGFNQLQDSAQQTEAEHTRATDKLTLAGPLKLVQGGSGVVGRLPVFLKDSSGQRYFWGFTNVTIRMEKLLASANLRQLQQQGMAYKLTRIDPATQQEQVITAYQPEALVQAITHNIAIPNGQWQLSIAPAHGWIEPVQLGLKILLGMLVSMLLAYQMAAMRYLQQRKHILEHAVQARTHELSATQLQLEATLNAVPDLLFDIDKDGVIYECRVPRQYALPIVPDRLIGKPARAVLPSEAWATLASAIQEADELGISNGKCYSVEQAQGTAFFELSIARKSAVADQDARFIVLSRDITERRANEERLQTLAFFDPLTKLPNRRLFLDRLEHAIVTHQRQDHAGAVLFIDLDDFKAINENRGRHIGDMLLIAVAERLRQCVRVDDTVAHLGSDEFLVLLEGLGKASHDAANAAQQVAEKIQAALNQAYVLEGEENFNASSIGIAVFTDNQQSGDALLKQAEQAMHHAKASGRNTFRFFDPTIQASTAQRFVLRQELREALHQGQFELYYQPQLDQHYRIYSAEALVRWQHPRRGMVPPMEFIPLAEESGLILPLGIWILESACAQLLRWSTVPETAHLAVAVNVSARQFQQPQFVDQVLTIVNQTGINPRQLMIELTESMLVDNPDEMIIKMSALQAVGIQLSLDDFGSGYSSLAYLKRLPINEIKIDKAFVQDIHSDPNDAAIALAIIRLAQSMELKVIAEGVETQPQRDWLEHHGCLHYQGYYFGKPMAISAFNALFTQA